MAIHQYIYQASNKQGEIIEGQIGAETQQEVVATLQNQQLIPLKVQQQAENKSLFTKQTISNQDVINFTDGLCTLIEAQIPLDKTLGLLEGTTKKPAVQEMIEDLRRDIKEGKSLADALRVRPDIFSNMYINMIHAGEEGGILDQLLPKLTDFLSSAEATKRGILASLIYPIVLGIVGFSSVLLLLVFVVPSFATLFEDMGSNIPPSAAFLLGLSAWLKTYGWTLLFIPIIIIIAWKRLDTTPQKQWQRDNFLLSLPILGDLILQAESSRFCRTLGALLNAGIPLLKGLHISKGVLDNQVLSASLAQIEEAVRGGASLGRALINDGRFPILLSQLVVVGEESGRTAKILDKLAETFDGYVKQQTTKLVALLEPLLILILGVIVGAIVITMLSAIFSINQINA
ncbi:MAG: type II secretion system F family protein [Thiomargarita sp.]|nr:type II secretion system F family protein [Thiomargarita sp.]